MRENRDFRPAVIELAEWLGWRVWWTPDSRRSNPDEPDLRLCRPPRVIFAELKVPPNRPTKGQREALAALAECPGVEAHLWTPADFPDAIQRVLAR